MKLLQINLNRSGRVQDLMQQYMYENKIQLALVSEPNRIPRGNWLGDATGLAAVHWGIGESCALVRRGTGYVAIEIGEHIIISTYCSPNVNREEFKELLDEIGRNIDDNRNRKIIIGGDLNARSRQWDVKQNARGYIFEKWIDEKKMIVLNDGQTETCVRAQGSSRVDITIATEKAASQVVEWKVDGEAETLSDHRYIRINVGEKLVREKGYRGKIFPRWNITRCDRDWYTVSIVGGMWLNNARIKEKVEEGEMRGLVT